jgi:hypothetical protein
MSGICRAPECFYPLQRNPRARAHRPTPNGSAQPVNNPFSPALHIKNPSSTKCAASIQSAARLATVLIARACRFTARGRIGFAATGRRVVVAHSEKRILVSSRKRCLRDHAQGSYRCSGRAHCSSFREFPRTAGILFTETRRGKPSSESF